jgi:cell wall-associated NlpC family hydrolase
MLALVAVCSCTVIGSARPASAGDVGSAKAHAAALYSQLQSLGTQISSLGQQWDLEQVRSAQLSIKIHDAKLAISHDRVAVVGDRSSLQKAAVNAYVDSGTVASTNPLFAANANQLGATSVYNQIAEGNLTGSVANLTNAQANLHTHQVQLNDALGAAERARTEAARARAHAVALQGQVNAELRAANAEVQSLLLVQQHAAQVAAAASFSPTVSAPQQNFPAPPPDSRGNIAVNAALSQLGVPYRWAASSPKGTSYPGFDCSGLTMWAWGQAGVSLPHYSGAQMADSAPVPLSNLQPGDLLFYGPGGSEHVAMYVGHGTMIEAPYTGAYVWLTPVRFGYGFAGAGRP